MQLLGQPVRHNAFGTGVITGLSGNIITIDFAQGEKRFQYPDAFSRFLTLKDAGKQNEIRAGYERRLRAERAERQKELERQERLGKIRSMKVTPYSQAAFDIPWKEAKAAAEGRLAFFRGRVWYVKSDRSHVQAPAVRPALQSSVLCRQAAPGTRTPAWPAPDRSAGSWSR